jgi:hypothetical protein
MVPPGTLPECNANARMKTKTDKNTKQHLPWHNGHAAAEDAFVTALANR